MAWQTWAYICAGQRQAADLGRGGGGADSFALCLYSFRYQPGHCNCLNLGLPPSPRRNSELNSGVLDEEGSRVREGQHYINKKKVLRRGWTGGHPGLEA